MNPDTYYRATRREPGHYAPLAGASKARVAIVGGGYAGLATALGLAERGFDGVTLLEAESIGFGASGRNGGFVFGGYSLGDRARQKSWGPVTKVGCSDPFRDVTGRAKSEKRSPGAKGPAS
jgi:gamma-glutamylputrescine oxidase